MTTVRCTRNRNHRRWRYAWLLIGALGGMSSIAAAASVKAPAPSTKASRMEPDLRAAWMRSLQARSAETPAFHFAQTGTELVASHPNQGYQVRLKAAQLEISIGDERLSLEAPMLRCRAAAKSAQSARNLPKRGKFAHQGIYTQPGFEEWYENGTLGLEHGFTLNEKPQHCADDEPLRWVMQLGGSLQAKKVGENIDFVAADGHAVLRYSDLWAKDASGRALKSRMEVADQELSLLVEAQGAAYPLTVDPLLATQAQKILAPNSEAFENFGYAIALSADGNTAVFGDDFKHDLGKGCGAAYVFVRTQMGWSLQTRLLPSDAAEYDELGQAVALSADGNTALIGAPSKSDSPLNGNGAAYVFVRTGTTWSQQAKLLASDRQDSDRFGRAVALSGDGNIAMIGADHVSTSPLTQNGAAYVFVRTNSTWGSVEQSKLQPSDKISNDQFGGNVALSADGNTALIAVFAIASCMYLYAPQEYLTRRKRPN